MTLERIRELYDAEPFRPFWIHLADGREIGVLSREFILPAPSGRTLVVFEPDDRMHIIDLLLVTELYLEPNGKKQSKGNGKKKKR